MTVELASGLRFRYSSPDLRVVCGDGLARLSRELDRAEISTPLVVTSPSVARDPEIRAAVVDALGDRTFAIFAGVEPDCPQHTIVEAARAAARAGCDGLVALGGGSAIVTARALSMAPKVAERAGEGLPLLNVPYVVIPTTPTTAMARTGAAVSMPAQQRVELFDPGASPKAILVDAELIVRTPNRVFLDTAVATFCNAAELFTTPSLPPPARSDLGEAVRLSASALLAWRTEVGSHNADTRLALATAAFLCGRAAGLAVRRQATFGLALGHLIQGLAPGNAHGASMAAAVGAGLRVNRAAAAVGQRELLHLLSEYVDAEDPASAVAAVLTRVGHPARPGEMGVTMSALRPRLDRFAGSYFVRSNVTVFDSLEEMEEAIALAIQY